jgi:hypothetical protein
MPSPWQIALNRALWVNILLLAVCGDEGRA